MFKGIVNDFKKFALRGNVMDMAIGIIIGAAFGKIVDSLVKDIIMPPLGLILGKVDFQNLFIVLQEGKEAGPYVTLESAQKAGAITLNIGSFINLGISFLIIAFAVFLLVKVMNGIRSRFEEEKSMVSTMKECKYCCSVIPINAKKCPNCTSDLVD